MAEPSPSSGTPGRPRRGKGQRVALLAVFCRELTVAPAGEWPRPAVWTTRRVSADPASGRVDIQISALRAAAGTRAAFRRSAGGAGLSVGCRGNRAAGGHLPRRRADLCARNLRRGTAARTARGFPWQSRRAGRGGFHLSGLESRIPPRRYSRCCRRRGSRSVRGGPRGPRSRCYAGDAAGVGRGGWGSCRASARLRRSGHDGGRDDRRGRSRHDPI